MVVGGGRIAVNAVTTSLVCVKMYQVPFMYCSSSPFASLSIVILLLSAPFAGHVSAARTSSGSLDRPFVISKLFLLFIPPSSITLPISQQCRQSTRTASSSPPTQSLARALAAQVSTRFARTLCTHFTSAVLPFWRRVSSLLMVGTREISRSANISRENICSGTHLRYLRNQVCIGN